MPIYTFLDTKTNKEFTEMMSNQERIEYLKENPDVTQVLSTLHVGDPMSLGVRKPDAAFQKHVIGRIKDRVPGNNMSYSRYNIPKEV